MNRYHVMSSPCGKRRRKGVKSACTAFVLAAALVAFAVWVNKGAATGVPANTRTDRMYDIAE